VKHSSAAAKANCNASIPTANPIQNLNNLKNEVLIAFYSPYELKGDLRNAGNAPPQLRWYSPAARTLREQI